LAQWAPWDECVVSIRCVQWEEVIDSLEEELHDYQEDLHHCRRKYLKEPTALRDQIRIFFGASDHR